MKTFGSSLALICVLAISGCMLTQTQANRRLWRAVDEGDLDLARSTFELADLNARNRFGSTALHGAVQNKDPEMVRLLLDAGANPDTRNASGYPPLSEVIDLNIARMLLDAGATACRVEMLQKIIVTDRSRIMLNAREKAELRQIIHLIQWRRRRCWR